MLYLRYWHVSMPQILLLPAMLKRLYISLILLLSTVYALASTPVEDIMYNYMEVRGVRHLVAKGAKMNMVRPVLRTYPIAPLADDVQYLIVLKMDKASDADRKTFEKDLKSVLMKYEYCATQEAKDFGMADVYIYSSFSGEIVEIVVYNPDKSTLNSLQGVFPLDALLSLRK